MAVTKTTNIDVMVRKIDFTSSFTKNIQRMLDVLGVSNRIKQQPGTDVRVITAIIPSLSSSPAEGGEITPSTASISDASLGTIPIEKHSVGATAEAILKYGYEVAVAKADEAFISKHRNNILSAFYTFLATGTASASAIGFQATLSACTGKVKEFFLENDLGYTGTVAFVNINDVYEYLGSASITMQNENGMFYLENFLGVERVILCDSGSVASGTMYVTAMNNIIAYHIDPSTADLARAGLVYDTDETGLIGVAPDPAYDHASAFLYTLYGILVAGEYLGGICVGTIR